MKIVLSEKQLKRLKESKGPEKCFTDLGGVSFISYCNTSEVKNALANIPKDVVELFLNRNEFADFSNIPLKSYRNLESISLNDTKTNLEKFLPADSYEKEDFVNSVEYILLKPKPFEKTPIDLNGFLDMVKNRKGGENVYWDKISKKFYVKVGNKNYILKVD